MNVTITYMNGDYKYDNLIDAVICCTSIVLDDLSNKKETKFDCQIDGHKIARFWSTERNGKDERIKRLKIFFKKLKAKKINF